MKMQMKIEQLWKAMEAESPSVAGAELLMRRALPEAGYPLFVAFEPGTGSRLILLPVFGTGLPARSEWPDCRGLELSVLQVNGQVEVAVRLKSPDVVEVFSVLAQDVASYVTTAKGSREAVARLFDRLQRWQILLAVAQDGLTAEAQRGLWGELYVLQAHLIPAFGPVAAVAAWRASEAAHQDFQFGKGSIEVKTSSAKQPQQIRIASERQLDDTGTGPLFLLVLSVDERVVGGGGAHDRSSLAGVIQSIRHDLKGSVQSLVDFNERLLKAGWFDTQAERYEGSRWTIRNEALFEVRGGFPRIVESDLPSGVGDVKYSISLAACGRFAANLDDVLSVLAGSGKTDGGLT